MAWAQLDKILCVQISLCPLQLGDFEAFMGDNNSTDSIKLI